MLVTVNCQRVYDFFASICFIRYCTNVGSVHKFNSAAILSLVNSDLSVCASLLSWLIVMYLTKRNYRMTDLLQGIIVGLVGKVLKKCRSMSVFEQLHTYPSPDPTTVN